ncbi:MAG TPA: nucleotide sugar dehydrogenase [Thermoleophilaceae bacterium]|nr:nucleotide sugar dehydrogenase [Thermoleophilaceae bacterium]
MSEPIGVVGVGWVGLVTAACFAELGHEVYARDILEDKIDALRRGEVPIHEPDLPELVRRNSERLHFTTAMSEVAENARLLFCCVDTPPTYSGDADLSRVESVVAELREGGDHALVMKSTVPVGTGHSITRRRPDLGYVSNPEFLKEGSAVADFMNPDRVVVGADEGSGEYAAAVAALYEPLGVPIIRTDLASAEMIKLASNAFLATKISFINEIANVSEEVGADVAEVARGMGLDDRIGPKFLRAGVGYGGSCLHGDETVLVRHHGRTTLLSFADLWERLAEEDEPEDDLIAPHDLEVLSFLPEQREPLFLPVMCVTRREYEGELLTVRTKMGRKVTTTPDHPFLVTAADGGEIRRDFAKDLTTDDWLPLALKRSEPADAAKLASILSAVEAAELSPEQLIVRPRAEEVAALVGRPVEERRQIFTRAKSVRARTADYIRHEIELDEGFWRVVGLYIAEGCARRAEQRLQWSFHPDREEHLVQEVVTYWARHGVRARVHTTPTSRLVVAGSRLLVAWWTRVLGLGANSYAQRLPDLIWDRPESDKWALLSGLFEGDGSWSLQNKGPSVVIEFGTVSDELADGVLRLLSELGVVASRRIGRARKSTKDTHWIRVSGADQVENAIELVPRRDRAKVLASIARQSKRIAPTGYRREGDGSARVRVTGVERREFSGPVFSMEVPGAHSFVTSGAISLSNCFPKDVQALKQLAGNTGYHFQLLTAVIEVNELQKRRTIGKLQKHLGSLVGKEIALLGVAFKPDTDDVREATSLVLSGRLQGEGASVRAYDPVAAANADGMLGGAVIAESALEALDGADAAVLVTEWPEFAELDWAGEVKRRMRVPFVVDGRNFLDREALVAAGFTYEGIGR